MNRAAWERSATGWTAYCPTCRPTSVVLSILVGAKDQGGRPVAPRLVMFHVPARQRHPETGLPHYVPAAGKPTAYSTRNRGSGKPRAIRLPAVVRCAGCKRDWRVDADDAVSVDE